MSAEGAAGDGEYAGLRVLDLASNLAGPLAAMVLGDLGADVIKVERPGTGDDTRSLVPSWNGDGTVFLSVNRNKRSVELDFRGEAGLEALLRLGASADIVIESFGPGVGDRLGVTYEAFRARNPEVVYCNVSAFGDGPIGSAKPGYDALVQGFTGMMSITGEPDGPPVRVAPSAVDLSTGLWLVIAIQAALRRRERSGEGERLDLALVDSAFNLMGHQLLGMLAAGAATPRFGTESPSSAPNGAYRAADGWLVIATANDRLFGRLCEAIELPELAVDERFRTTEDRIAARAELRVLLEDRFAERGVGEWIERLGAARVPAGPLNDLREAIEDPLAAERGLLVRPAEAAAEELPQLRLPIDREGSGIRRGPPALGAHTVEVLSELGLSAAEIAALGKAD